MPLANASYGYLTTDRLTAPRKDDDSRDLFFSPRQNALFTLISYFVLKPSTDSVLPVHTGYEMELVKIDVFPAEKPLVF